MPPEARGLRRIGRRRLRGLLALALLAALLLCRLWQLSFAAPRAGAVVREQGSLEVVLWAAARRAFRSGSAGFIAGICQVVAFMWLRTTMNHQYKHGGTFVQTVRLLWKEGGVRRFYRGLFPWALLQAPLARFGCTAANDAVLGVFAAFAPSAPLGAVTFVSSLLATCWRAAITPIDTCKTVLQTDGSSGWVLLRKKVATNGVAVLWYGWEGNYLAGLLGSYPWLFTVNVLSSGLPAPAGSWAQLLRNAAIGAVAACVSDLVSNSARVVKTKKQTCEDPNVGYAQAARAALAEDGLRGLFLRGLETRMMANVLQGVLFTVLWRGLSGRA